MIALVKLIKGEKLASLCYGFEACNVECVSASGGVVFLGFFCESICVI